MIENIGVLNALSQLSRNMARSIAKCGYATGIVIKALDTDCLVEFENDGKLESWYISNDDLKLIEVAEDEFDTEPISLLLK